MSATGRESGWGGGARGWDRCARRRSRRRGAGRGGCTRSAAPKRASRTPPRTASPDVSTAHRTPRTEADCTHLLPQPVQEHHAGSTMRPCQHFQADQDVPTQRADRPELER
eukprot:786278-Rhodomonas_salina.1